MQTYQTKKERREEWLKKLRMEKATAVKVIRIRVSDTVIRRKVVQNG